MQWSAAQPQKRKIKNVKNYNFEINYIDASTIYIIHARLVLSDLT